MINVHQKHIQVCGCPQGQFPKQINDLQTLVSQPTPNTSVGEFYNHMIWDDTLHELDFKKLNRIYAVKPFDLNSDIITTIKSSPMEAIDMVYNLVSRDNLETLPLLENTTLCTAEATVSIGDQIAQLTTTPAEERGVITSPNFPSSYPDSWQKTDTIRTKEGMAVLLEFTAFATESGVDLLTIKDGDGTILMEARGGYELPPKIWSHTNVAHLTFVTDGSSTYSGWSATWTTVAVCPPSWTALGQGCYMFLEERMNWFMAKAACEARSGYLVEVDTEDENNLLIAETQRLGLRSLWIGLNDLDNQGVWRWSRYRRKAVFTAFSFGKPSYNVERNGMEHCVILKHRNGWNNIDCYKRSTESSSSKSYYIGAICEI